MGVLFGFTYAIITGASNMWLVVGIAFIGVMIPNLDINFKTQLKREGWFFDFFLIPFLFALLIPSMYLTPLFMGYYGHVVNDLDKKSNFAFARRRAVTGLCWAVAVMTIMFIFGLTFGQTMQLFQ